MIRINMNDIRAGQQRVSRPCRDITHEVEVSPSPYNAEAYAVWTEKREREKREAQEKRDKTLPLVVDKDKNK